MNLAAQRTAGARLLALIALATIVGIALSVLGWQRVRGQWLYSYLVAWQYWSGLALGSLALLLLHNLTGGRWGDAVRPTLRAAASTLPLMAILLAPILFFVEEIYPWADAYPNEHDAILQHKQTYLNADFFRIRAGVYFAIWLALLLLLTWQSRRPAAPDSHAHRRLRRLSGQGLVLHGLAVTFAAIDWMMSLEPHWFSTIYGVIAFASQGLAALALAAAVASASAARAGGLSAPAADVLHDLGKLLLGFLMFWAYVSFSQFFIIWYGNLPEEVVWYQKRIVGGWQWAALALVFLNFVIPFMLLLGRELKRTPTKLAAVAIWLLFMRWIETVWLVQPAIEHSDVYRIWLDAGLTLAMGGLWLGAFALGLPRVERDPYGRGAEHG